MIKVVIGHWHPTESIEIVRFSWSYWCWPRFKRTKDTMWIDVAFLGWRLTWWIREPV